MKGYGSQWFTIASEFSPIQITTAIDWPRM